MRRLLVILFALTAGLGGGSVVLAPAGPAGAQAIPDDPRLGLIYEGLRASGADSLCGGAFESYLDAAVEPWMKQVLCTHGPDPAPEGVDVREDRPPDEAAELAFPSAATAAEGGAVPCYGTGSDGFRVQLVYARSAARTDRFASYAASFRSWAARMDQVVNNSAAETGGTRHIRFVTDTSCNPVVDRVTLSADAMSNFPTMVSELHSRGYSRTDRKYVVWADANVYCGISHFWADDTGDPTPGRNYNNGNPSAAAAIGRIDNGCWGLSNLVEAHELVHLLGGVQPSAPNATSNWHCKDESDRLCYADGSGATMRQVCPTWHETLYDCNHDDYFSTAPAPGSYLATHWNTANSAFLSGQPVATPVSTTVPPPTTTTTTAPPATTTTIAPPTATTTSTTVAPVTTTTLGPTATTTTVTPLTTPPPAPPAPPPPPAPTGATPSSPQSLSATQPAVGAGVQLSWQRPATGPVTGYRVYRGTTPYNTTLLAELPDVLGYNDATAGRALYFYRVTALNAAGEGPSSALTGMIGKAPTAAGSVREDIDRRLIVSHARMRSALSPRWA